MNPEIQATARQQIGRFIRDRRKELGYGLVKTSAIAGVEKKILQNIEAGGNYTINSLLAVLGALRCRVYFETADPGQPVGVEAIGEN